MQPAISATGLSKRYVLKRGPRLPYLTLRGTIRNGLRRLLPRAGYTSELDRKLHGDAREEFWALHDVSFTIPVGSRVGIVGRNGAGKSTLLKILSRVIDPTAGHALIKGRVASLLEVGTGFHPELTGRENILLNGAILGMTKAEVRRKLDEIVAFAEVSAFLDTPVKRYSSGMYMRLAFAVAAHLEAEVVLVDEVLAVGDLQFQKKCLGKMDDISRSGKTVVFVSHNLTSISELCDRAIWLDAGRIRSDGDARHTVQAYLASGLSGSGGRAVFDVKDRGDDAVIKSVTLRNEHGDVASQFDVLSPFSVEIEFACRRRFSRWRLHLIVTRYDGVVVFSTTTWDYNLHREAVEAGAHVARLVVPGRFLAESSYLLTVTFGEPPDARHDVRENFLGFDITGQAFDYGRKIGLLAYPFEWQIDKQHA
jgi:homopolymeric O-antigen transport system ATP-binding protein